MFISSKAAVKVVVVNARKFLLMEGSESHVVDMVPDTDANSRDNHDPCSL